MKKLIQNQCQKQINFDNEEKEERKVSRADTGNTALSFSHNKKARITQIEQDKALRENLFGEKSDIKSEDLLRFYGKNVMENISKISSKGGEDYLVLDCNLFFDTTKFWIFANKMDGVKSEAISEFFIDGTEEEVIEARKYFGSEELYFEIGDLCFFKKQGFKDAAGKFFNYVFEVFGIRFCFEVPQKNEMNAKIIVSSTPLMIFDGLEKTYEKIKYVLRKIGAEILRERISRIDLCIDLVGIGASEFTKEFTSGRAITKAGSWAIYGKFSKCTGFSVGKTAIKMRIYDKVEETKKNDLKRFILEKKRWNGVTEKATRVEFQLNREYLKKSKINSVESFLKKRFQIAHFLTKKWFRICEEIKDRTHTLRTKLSRLWTMVKESFEDWTKHSENEPIEYELGKLPKASGLASQIYGCLLSLVSIENLCNGFGKIHSEMLLKFMEILEAKGEAKIEHDFLERRKKFRAFDGLFDELALEGSFERAIT